MSNTLKIIGKKASRLKPGQRIIITFKKSYANYDFDLLKNKIAEYGRMRSECLTVDTESIILPTDNENIETIIYTKVILIRTDFMSALDTRREWYAGRWIKDLVQYYELANTITDPEPYEIPKFHL